MRYGHGRHHATMSRHVMSRHVTSCIHMSSVLSRITMVRARFSPTEPRASSPERPCMRGGRVGGSVICPRDQSGATGECVGVSGVGRVRFSWVGCGRWSWSCRVWCSGSGRVCHSVWPHFSFSSSTPVGPVPLLGTPLLLLIWCATHRATLGLFRIRGLIFGATLSLGTILHLAAAPTNHQSSS